MKDRSVTLRSSGPTAANYLNYTQGRVYEARAVHLQTLGKLT